MRPDEISNQSLTATDMQLEPRDSSHLSRRRGVAVRQTGAGWLVIAVPKGGRLLPVSRQLCGRHESCDGGQPRSWGIP